jgi:hypothetical protein
MRFDGFISLDSITTPGGVIVPAAEAASQGLISEKPALTEGWPKLSPWEIPVGVNHHTNGGRQMMIYCWGNRAPITDFACTQFGFGTGSTPVTVDDLGLAAQQAFSSGDTLKGVDAIDYPEPYIARVRITLSASDATGILVSELGLFSGNGTLLHRTVLDVPFNKGNVAKSYLWRIRF